ncbi:Capsular polysaccharide biosynthesis protein CapD [Sterolibacterium denitrificans]|uniref:Capsular polysaccharide biosynthesis protein CapD n=2 Tax=Sterolibacterium denitrificans TaxID=157592 RepID=A0A7Z7HPA1_9PROT|nr:nucleoside-diphosphate sugar epimerase/dehydratase [Sterolibacterium denitrificans]KYC29042.1 multidrug MFS transporter [Sterolibacterium denitrificans]SMB21278.1 Capsular polysaccharide biosynthesis protein CapD [Sterolibacterium denitrificans]
MRTLLVVLHDLAATALAWMLAYWLRFNFAIPAEFMDSMLITLAAVIPLQTLIAWRLGLYRGIWRFASLPDLKRIVLAGVTGAILLPLLLYMLQIMVGVPRSVLVLYPLLLILFVGSSRFLYRSWKDGHLLKLRAVIGEPVLVLGAGEAALLLLRELDAGRQWHVVGLLDDDAKKRGRLLHGVPVLGALDELATQAQAHGIDHVILAIPSASHALRRRISEMAGAAGITVLTVPAFDDLLSGRVTISQIRKFELEDLLGRDPVQLDEAGLHRMLTDKVVLVTGAGGSIGAELCRQVARFVPRRLVLFEMSEFALYTLEQQFLLEQPQLDIVCAIGDVRDGRRLAEVFAAQRPAVVFHAAAYKHVPLMENANAWQAVRNNVLGTFQVARAALDHGVERFVLISTDKAVNPTNVMGASKRLAELLCQALGRAARHGAVDGRTTRFVMVRFGNVLGSSGSVIPRFREQIARGGPVTVTHPDIIRYFMLIPEAAQLVLQAGLMGGEPGRGNEIFVLDMGEPVRIVDLARDMIRLSGFNEGDIRIEFTGLRPGEKLYEELLADGEQTLPTPHPKLRVARAGKANETDDDAWLAELQRWLAQENVDEAEVKAALQRWVAEYKPARS